MTCCRYLLYMKWFSGGCCQNGLLVCTNSALSRHQQLLSTISFYTLAIQGWKDVCVWHASHRSETPNRSSYYDQGMYCGRSTQDRKYRRLRYRLPTTLYSRKTLQLSCYVHYHFPSCTTFSFMLNESYGCKDLVWISCLLNSAPSTCSKSDFNVLVTVTSWCQDCFLIALKVPALSIM